MTYLKGFTDGVMIVGKYKDAKVSEAKPKIKQEMIDAGLAILYSEVSRERRAERCSIRGAALCLSSA